MQLRGSRRQHFGVVALMAGATVLATTSLASAHGGDTSKLHGCIVPSSGYLRIVDAGAECKKGETAVDWSMGTEAAAGSITGEGSPVAGATGQIALGTITGQGTDGPATGNLALGTVGRANIRDEAISTAKIAPGMVTLDRLATDVGVRFLDADDLAAYDYVDASELGLLKLRDPSDSGPNDGGGYVHWYNLEGVPGGFVDGLDDDGAALVSGLADELNGTTGDTLANEGTDPVSFHKIRDLAGQITSHFIENATITAEDLGASSVGSLQIANGEIRSADLAGEYDASGNEIVVGAVTSANIADETIQDRDVAAGTLTPDKLKANAVTGFGGPMTIDALQGPVAVATAIADIRSGRHRVLLHGAALVTCDSGCVGGDVTVGWTLKDDDAGTVVSQNSITLTSASPMMMLPISAIPTVDSVTGPLHDFSLRVEVHTAAGTVLVSNPVLHAVDLGRA